MRKVSLIRLAALAVCVAAAASLFAGSALAAPGGYWSPTVNCDSHSYTLGITASATGQYGIHDQWIAASFYVQNTDTGRGFTVRNSTTNGSWFTFHWLDTYQLSWDGVPGWNAAPYNYSIELQVPTGHYLVWVQYAWFNSQGWTDYTWASPNYNVISHFSYVTHNTTGVTAGGCAVNLDY